MGTRWLEDGEADQNLVIDPDGARLAPHEIDVDEVVGAAPAKLAGTLSDPAEDSHNSALRVHAADPRLVGIDYAGDALVREQRDLVALAQRQGGGADCLGREDGVVDRGVILTAGDGEGQECADGVRRKGLHWTEMVSRGLGPGRHERHPPGNGKQSRLRGFTTYGLQKGCHDWSHCKVCITEYRVYITFSVCEIQFGGILMIGGAGLLTIGGSRTNRCDARCSSSE